MSSPDLELERCPSDDEWDAFVRASPHGSVFVTSAFLRALPVTAERWLLRSAGTAQAGAVVLVDDDGRPVPAPYAFSLYQGVLMADPLASGEPHRRVPRTMRVVEAMLGLLAERHPSLSFCFHPAFEDLRPVLWFNYGQPEDQCFAVRLLYTGHIDLAGWQGTDTYLRSIRETRRQDYNRGRRNGLTVAPSDDIALLEDLYAKTFDRQAIDVPAATLGLVRSLAEAALSAGFGEILVCRSSDGVPLSALLAVRDQRAAYYLILGNDPEHRAAGGGTFLTVEFVARAADHGAAYVDVCGMNSPNRGDFKASFNAMPVPYHVATWAPGR